MESPTLPGFKAFSVLEERHTGRIQIFASLRDPKNGELKTQEFFERVADGRSMHGSKPVSWEHILPAGALPVGAAAGNPNEFYNIFWEIWSEGSTLQALALTQEDPISVAVLPSDRQIHSPILGMDKKCRVFFWRKTEAGYSLFQHIFSGEVEQKSTVVTEKIMDITYEPLSSRADPISIFLVRKKGFEEKGLAVIGWLSSEGGNMRAHAVWIHGKEAKVFDSDPIAGYKPHPEQRLGIYGDPDGFIHLAWLMGRADADSFRVANLKVDVNQDMKSTRICENSFTGTKIQSSACLYYRISEATESSCFLLTDTGNLYEQRALGKPRKLRSGVPLTYDFPIFASGYQTYEARLKPDGTLYFDSP